MEKIPCSVHTRGRQLKTKKKKKDAITQHITGSELPLPTVRSKRGPIHADASPGRLLSISSSFAKTNLKWVSNKSKQCYW